MWRINTRQCPSECSLTLVGVSVLPLPLSHVDHETMTSQRVNKLKEDAIAAAQLDLRAVKDTSHVFLNCSHGRHYHRQEPGRFSLQIALLFDTDRLPIGAQRVTSNKSDCQRLGQRAAGNFHNIWRQTKDYGNVLPVEVRQSIGDIERSEICQF
jgi:hypothetical protein